MLNPAGFFELLTDMGVEFYCGVPDSLLKPFCSCLSDRLPSNRHFITANEGAAVGLAAGVYLATGKPALVYMQNSGVGNAVNPLTSLADPKVYGIPMLLIIGWRGEPGVKDEPQHAKQGEITLEILKTLGIPYEVLPQEFALAEAAVNNAFEFMRSKAAPYALVVRKDTFEPYGAVKKDTTPSPYTLTREEAIQIILKITSTMNKPVFVSTTGMASRELYENRIRMGRKGDSDFLTVGSMGHASSIALGIALNEPDRTVFCIDGDGAMLMHMGALATIAEAGVTNFKHIVINNGAHDSVGGQPTCGFKVDFGKIAQACGYPKTYLATTEEELVKTMEEFIATKELGLLEVRVKRGARGDLGRPKTSPAENKIKFMQYLKD
ncbi:MAG TPA: phosphonopyruvate decarboxylase [Smithella sp.]|nr:phosphonopyruvate decarboxylase [Smithella sp.]